MEVVMLKFKSIKSEGEIEKCLEKIGFIKADTQNEMSDYTLFSDQDINELLVDPAFGRFILHMNDGRYFDHTSYVEDELPIYKSILLCIFE